ncbi:MAG: hypothetical protein KTR30_07925 [Saprospiraceae bacterium]|nr:hypothetical protein [Saprospiraceae bacterium]
MYFYRISCLLLLCLSFSSLIGQVNVAIMGKVNQPVDTLVTLIVPPVSLGGESSTVTTRLSDKLEFRFTIRTNITTPAVISYGGFNIPIFIVPEQSFSLEFTADQREPHNLLFRGKGGADNTFLHQYIQFLAAETPPIDSSVLGRTTAKEYRRLMDQNRIAREHFLENHSQVADLEVSPQLLQWLQNDITYTYATALLRYPSVFRDFHHGTKSRNPSNAYYSFLEGIPFNNPDAILQDSYQRFLESFIIHKLERPMSWELRTGGERQYAVLSRFLFGPPLYYMQSLVFERTLNWLVDPDYMAKEYRSFMASEAPALLKQKLEKLRENPPKVYSIKSFSIIGSPVLGEVFQFHTGDRPDSSFFQGQPTLLYFHNRRISRVDFIIRYLKKLSRNLENRRDINICLVDVNTKLEAWQSIHSKNGYANHPFTHLSMNYFDELFDPRIEQGTHPEILIVDANGIVTETLDWKPPVKQVLAIIDDLE